jgi:hypothetical protein
MPLNNEIASSLQYLRKRYKVSEPDLVALAKRLQAGEESEESWEDLTRDYLEKKRRRR